MHGEDTLLSADSGLFAPSVLHRAIFNPAYAQRMSDAMKRSSLLNRAVVMALLNTPFHRDVFVGMMKKNVAPPISLMVFYPDVRFRMLSMYVLTRNCGVLNMGMPNVMSSAAPNDYFYVKFNCYLGAAITDEHNATVVPNTAFAGILPGSMAVASLVKHDLGGDNSHALLGDFRSRDAYSGEGYVISAGISKPAVTSTLDITGGFHADSYFGFASPNAFQSLINRPTYPSAMYHWKFVTRAMGLGRSTMLGGVDATVYRHNMESRPNTICVRGPQWIYGTNSQPIQVAEGHGWTQNVVPGKMRDVYNGSAVLGGELVVKVSA
jgi:hypothetical protein